jgi:Fe-Mn family superoxide dismutase
MRCGQQGMRFVFRWRNKHVAIIVRTFGCFGCFCSKQTVMKTIIFTSLAILVLAVANTTAQNAIDQKLPDQFPALPYAYNALEPYIDAATMEVHYSKHHQTYYDKFKAAIKGTDLEQQSLKAIFAGVGKASPAVRNHGGGYYNHLLFWENMTPEKQQLPEPLNAAIIAKFGSTDNFKAEFGKAALGVFGSGWAWLILDANKQLAIVTTPNQDNPLMDIAPVKGTPLLALDVWEHAYYLKYQNKRPDYVAAFWNVVNWTVVGERFDAAQK